MLLRTTFSLEGFAASWATFYSTEIKIAGNRDMVAVRRPRNVADADFAIVPAHLLELDPAFTISAWIARGGQSNASW